MATTQDIRKGLTINYKNDLYTIVDFLHVKPGKGGAFVRTKMNSITSGKVIEQTFNSGETIDSVTVNRRRHQFLYKDGEGYHFMDQGSFEQVTLQDDIIEGSEYLKEGQEADIAFHADTQKPLICEMPPHVTLEIINAEPGTKGDTANNPLKRATLETGAVVNVPLFVKEGEKVKIDIRTGQYIERVK
jgi:elongation factor P